MRFKALRAKKWWMETMTFLNSIRETHKFKNIFDEIEKKNIGPLHLTRISSPETARTSARRYHRRAYPMSTGCIDFEQDKNRITPSTVFDDHFMELQRKYRRKKKKKSKYLFQSLNELHRIE